MYSTTPYYPMKEEPQTALSPYQSFIPCPPLQPLLKTSTRTTFHITEDVVLVVNDRVPNEKMVRIIESLHEILEHE